MPPTKNITGKFQCCAKDLSSAISGSVHRKQKDMARLNQYCQNARLPARRCHPNNILFNNNNNN